jgi:hypothetical protein
MEVDEYLLELNFILLNGETAYKDATMAFKITLPSTANTRDIRVAVRQECTLYNVPFEDIRLDKLDVYKASLSPSESKALLQELKSGRRIATSEWKTSLLGDLGLLSHYFTKQPDKTAIHLVVDCTEAGKSSFFSSWDHGPNQDLSMQLNMRRLETRPRIINGASCR